LARDRTTAHRKLILLATSLQDDQDPQDELGEILDAAIQLTSADRALIVTRDREGHYDMPLARTPSGKVPEDERVFSRTMVEAAIASGSVLPFDKSNLATPFSEKDTVLELEFRSALVAPLFVEGRPPAAIVLLEKSRAKKLGPEDGEDLRSVAKLASRVLELVQRSGALARERDHARRPTPFVGSSAVMRELHERIVKAASVDEPALITGESGTGKELAARALHAQGKRRAGPFVPTNVAALPEALVESELFGHEEGAFTGAHASQPGLFRRAHGGTLFLDEIGDMPLALQAKVLRAIQEKRVQPLGSGEEEPVDVRIVAATHRDLKRHVQEGKFREDLFYRLRVIRLDVPPLRERREDIPLLAKWFGQKIARERRVPERSLTPAALEKLARHNWPGNVRELEGVLCEATLFARGDPIDAQEIRLDEPGPLAAPTGRPRPDDAAILAAVARHGSGNAAARALGFPTSTFGRWLGEARERSGGGAPGLTR
jgi:transcriptional regulator with GAF, ATPase, and Fis domain